MTHTITVFLILSLENGEWIRCGPVHKKKNVAKEWLSFVLNGRPKSRLTKLETATLTIIDEKWTDESVKLMDEKYNVDLT